MSQKAEVVQFPKENVSILSPLLFTIYINDIPCSQNSHLTVYGDVTAIFASSWNQTNAIKFIPAYLDQLQNYFTNWKLKINPVYMRAIAFKNRRSKPKSNLHRRTQYSLVPPLVKYLGVLLDAEVIWTQATTKEQI